MYEIWIRNGTERELLHDRIAGSLRKVRAGSFAEEVGEVWTSEASIEVFPQNPAYTRLHELTTHIEFYNTLTGKTEFEGRMLKPKQAMDADGIVGMQFRCEGLQAYLCDSRQMYVNYGTAPNTMFLEALLYNHNRRCPDKQIRLGRCDVSAVGSKTTAYRTTLAEMKENLTSRQGGEIRIVRNVQGELSLEYLQAGAGQRKSTAVELGRNIVSIQHSSDATHVISRLIPLGAQLNHTTAERLTLKGYFEDDPERFYIEDAAAMAEYGPVEGTVEFDEITTQETLAAHAQAYLAENNRVRRSYRAQVLDLSTIGEDADAFCAGNTYRFVCPLIGLDEELRIIKRTVDIFEPYKPVIEIGDKSEKLTGIQTRTAKLIEYALPQQKSDILAVTQGMIADLMDGGLSSNIIYTGNEMLILDAESIEEAQDVWRINGGGIAHSTNGYQGPFNVAILMDGTVAASFLLAGSVVAQNLTITGGRIAINADEDDYDYINLNYKYEDGHTVHTHMTPLEFAATNADNGAKCTIQAAGVFLDSPGDTNIRMKRSGQDKVQIFTSGESADVRAWSDFYQAWISLYDHEARIRTLEQRLQGQ